MKSFNPNQNGPSRNSGQSSWLPWFLIIGALLVAIIGVLLPRPKAVSSKDAHSSNRTASTSTYSKEIAARFPIHQPGNFATRIEPAKSAEEIVAEKVKQFDESRRAIAQRIALRLNQNLPPEIGAFFDAIESGNWDEIHSRWKALAAHAHQYKDSKGDRPDLDPYWEAVLDAYGVAEQAHKWPAQQLLDYGNAILDSLQPDMVYVGGTDEGRWVPELLDQTSGDPHIMITQNALADGMYLGYLRDLYGGQLNTLSQKDSQRAFQEYTADAQKRLQHDLDYPDEPKQVKPGESIKIVDGHVQVSGQTAVMAINAKLLQVLMQKNPNLSFAMEQSFPMQNLYADAVPMGPLMELGVPDAQSAFTAESAAQSVNYWQSIAQATFSDPEAAGSETTLKSYSHDVNSTANLLAAHNFDTEAEQAYRLSTQLWPGNPSATEGLAGILTRTGHGNEAQQLLDNFVRSYPDQRSTIEKFRGSILWNVSSAKPSP